ncbi:MAG: aromatic-ring-hydroxylating dioxygenase subunit beta [Acidimicrobiia bacterium]
MSAAREPTAVRWPARTEVEDFLFAEAALLDDWELEDWLALFREDGRYEVPATDDLAGDARRSQFLVSDDHERLAARVVRLLSRQAHAENPRSRTVRSITNVRVDEPVGDLVRVRANFVVHRVRDGHVDAYIGRYDHRLAVEPDGLRFVVRRALIVQEALRPGGRISFVI